MLQLKGTFLLVAGMLCAASSSPMLPIAHDRISDVGLQKIQTTQQRHMTSSFEKNAALPFADDATNAVQQLNLGRNLLNLEKRQHQHQQQPKHPSVVDVEADADVDVNVSAADKDRAVTRFSPLNVVQDWSLVCKELCGANLGGEPCAAQCAQQGREIERSKANHNEGKNAEFLLGDNKTLICKNLCEQKRGDNVCGCKNDENEVPAISHDLNKPCILCKKPHIPQKIEMVKPNRPFHIKKSPGRLDGTASTTPNWNELCASLCKTGDGGSLCNCDLSPFIN